MQVSPAVEPAKPAQIQISAEEKSRASIYGLLGALLAKPPSASLIKDVSGLSGEGNGVGDAINTISTLGKKLTVKAIEREYNQLFIGVGRGELLPYGSYYMTGFLNEKPLANLRRDMRELGIGRADGMSDPEDHVAALCDIMAGLILGSFLAPASLREQNDFFRVHLGPWVGHFFKDLEAASSSIFYAPVGKLGRVFMEIESDAFKLI
ncbi:MAG: molecular chaperone TorD family protein [Pseudomonadota bacterium]|nr:molecular chaperone TorD family protein [Pseudomonadota bacterium]